MPRVLQILFVVIILGMFLAACASRESVPTPALTIEPYRPPTQDPAVLQLQETETARLTAESLPTPTPVCENNLLFVEDVTIADGTVVAPGQRLDKRWKVENAGSCNWGIEFEVRLVAGPAMGVPTVQALFPALSGTELEIRMVFKAPADAGVYRSAWQAYDPKGEPFGETFFIDIIVSGE